jgi:cellobiose phosphorylase
MTSVNTAHAIERKTIQRYGRFVDDGACFELTSESPRRWRNLHYTAMGGVEMSAEISNLGDGPIIIRHRDGRAMNISGYDCTFTYLRDDEGNATFCPGGAPLAVPVQGRTTRYRAADTTLTAEAHGLRASMRVFVPADRPVAIRTLVIRNLEDRPRRVSVFQVTRFDIGGNLCADVTPALHGVWAWSRNPEHPTPEKTAFLSVQQHFFQAAGHRDSILRPEYSFGTPRLLDGEDLDGRSGYVFAGMGAVQSKVVIPAGGEVRLDILIGYAATQEDAATLLAEASEEAIDAWHAEQVEIEARRAAAYSIDTGDRDRDAVINHFVKKQLYSYLIAKNGFRDNLQVAWALVMADPRAASDILLRALAAQQPEGWAPQVFRPIDNTRRADKPAWILQVVPAHVQETGDAGFLQRVIPYQDGSTGTVYDHCLRAMRYLARDVRTHGLCDLHQGDWNDGLSPVGEAAQGGRESVMVTAQFCYGLMEMAKLAEAIGDMAVAEEARTHHRTFAERVNRHAWDGNWYQRVLCDDGFVIGTHAAAEGRIFLEGNAWTILGGIAPPERATMALDAIERHLCLDMGYRVTFPPFSTFDPRIGHSSSVLPGDIENGGCYNHAAGFKAVADCLRRRPEHAWNTYLKALPDNPDNPISHSKQEPFAFVNLFFTHQYSYGEAFYPWTTGTAAWFSVLAVEWILGVRRDYAGLRIDPCLTARVPRARVTRTFRGATFDLRIDNTAGRCCGTTSITVDGTPIRGNTLPDLRSGTHLVEVVI